ncbi:hypothetical protein CL617_01955 [archaeon]|nr:hypothetical protein [archaeon]|tara:strand:+ start:3876 stop:4154 length:279 start_codon:yes stop_codon:yes gene_type:complete
MWIEILLKKINRKNITITFSPHVFDRKEYWNLDLDKIEETIKLGKIFEKKCERPNKICFQRYFGKENITYIVITRFHKEFIEVKTTWPKKGR